MGLTGWRKRRSYGNEGLSDSIRDRHQITNTDGAVFMSQFNACLTCNGQGVVDIYDEELEEQVEEICTTCDGTGEKI